MQRLDDRRSRKDSNLKTSKKILRPNNYHKESGEIESMKGSLMRTLYLCGAGNPEGVRLALNINRTQKRWQQIIILDDDQGKHGQSILGVKIRGPFDFLEAGDPDSDEVINLVARTTRGRQAAMKKIESFGLPFTSLIDPSVDLLGVDVKRNTTVYQNAILCANASLGRGSVVFMRGLVGHGACVGQNCVVAPGAVINARVKIDEGVYIGSNASILPDLKIGAWATIGANSSVIEDVPAETTVIGIPAQIIMPQAGKQKGNTCKPAISGQSAVDESKVLPGRGPENKKVKSETLARLRKAQERIVNAHRSSPHSL